MLPEFPGVKRQAARGRMKQFVAIDDELLYRLDGPPGPLVPYQCGVFCWHRLRDEARAAGAGAEPAPHARAALPDERAALSA